SYEPLRKLVRPYILRRLKTDKRIINDLPDKTEMAVHCGLTTTQTKLYAQAVGELKNILKNQSTKPMQRKGLVLSYLMRFKQICNHPDQALGQGNYLASQSGKFMRLRELCEEIHSRQEKVLIFTQFQEMTQPLALFLETIFQRQGVRLHGGTPVKEREKIVQAFQSEQGPPFFVLSLKAGGTGLNLTAANHVIHFDRWWNPAVENQATDRAFRIGQKRNVLVHKFICQGTIEESIDALITKKIQLSNELLSNDQGPVLTQLSDDELLNLVALDLKKASI
ncbi:MAG: DEAD/DEAH box helicase, partial [Myxococcota bacterium]